MIKRYQSLFVYDDWKALCLQACWDLQPFALPLPAFVFLSCCIFPSSLSLSLFACVECCVHGGHFPAHCDDIDCRASPDCSLKYWPASSPRSKQTCMQPTQSVCVWVITHCQAPCRNAPQGECKSPELLRSFAYWFQWQPVGNRCLLFFLLPSYFCNNFTLFKRTAFWESHQESSIETENLILITHLIQLTGSPQWPWSNSSHSTLMH